MALGYYYYPVSNCTFSTCSLNVGFAFSKNGGATWSAAQRLAGPIQLSWLASTNRGRMVGDYMSTSYVGNTAFPVDDAATAPLGGVFQEHTLTNQQQALSATGKLPAMGHDRALASKAELAVHRWRGSAVRTAN